MTGLTVWFTGLSGAGKSTICQAAHEELMNEIGIQTQILDADEMRKYLCRGLGFSREDRDENIRRIGYVAELLTRNGVVVLVAAISPYRAVREEVRRRIGSFIEVFVDTPLRVCQERDPKGLYEKVRAGELKGFTGIDDPYEQPLGADLVLRTADRGIADCAREVVEAVLRWNHRAIFSASLRLQGGRFTKRSSG